MSNIKNEYDFNKIFLDSRELGGFLKYINKIIVDQKNISISQPKIRAI